MLMVKQGLYIYAWPLISYEGVSKFFDKLTVKPKSSESAATGREYALPGQLKNVPAHAIAWIKLFHAKALSGELCVHSVLSVRMLESVEPYSTITPILAFARKHGGFDDIN